MAIKSEAQDLPGSLAYTVANSDLGSLGSELAEVALDSVLKDGLLKDLPIIGSLVGLWKVGISVKDALLFRKLLIFLRDIDNLSKEKRARIIEELQSASVEEDVGEKLLTLLDRFDATTKAKLLSRTFCLLAEETITKDEFWRVAYTLDRLQLMDIFALRDWKVLDLNKVEHIRKHLYLSVGLGWFVIDFSSTGFVWQQRLCTIFSDHILVSVPGQRAD